MRVMASSSPSRLYDPLRRQWVANTPEERVRQHVLRAMVEDLGYPLGLIAIEREIGKLPHLARRSQGIPRRRVDIIVFTPSHDDLLPVLLIECKAEPLTPQVMNQVMGYNHYVQASAVAVVNFNEAQVLYCRGDRFHPIQALPCFDELLRIRYADPTLGELQL